MSRPPRFEDEAPTGVLFRQISAELVERLSAVAAHQHGSLAGYVVQEYGRFLRAFVHCRRKGTADGNMARYVRVAISFLITLD